MDPVATIYVETNFLLAAAFAHDEQHAAYATCSGLKDAGSSSRTWPSSRGAMPFAPSTRK